MTLIDQVDALLKRGHRTAVIELERVRDAIRPDPAPSVREVARYMPEARGEFGTAMTRLEIAPECVGGYVYYSDYATLARELSFAKLKLKRAAKLVASYKQLERAQPYAMFIPTWPSHV